MVPDGWHHGKLGDLFDNSRKKGKAGLPTMSVTLRDGLVRRDSLERKTDTNLVAGDHLLIEKDDIAYNMMRMWQGASGLAHYEALVSPAYIVLKPTSSIDPLFASYFFKTARMIYLFWAYSYGLTKDRLRLYFPDFALIPAVIPPVKEQRQIAKILNTWDRAVNKVSELIHNTKAQKRSLVQQLLTGTRRLPGYEHTVWASYPLGELVTLSKERFDPKLTDESRRCIELEHIEGNTGILLGECSSASQDSIKAVFRSGDVLFGKLRPYLRKYFHPRFEGVCSTEIWVLRSKPKVLPSYLLYLVQTDTFSRSAHMSAGSKMPRADWNVVRDTRFRIPDQTEQRAIVEAIQTTDQLVAHYAMRHSQLMKEKLALMQQLFSGKCRVHRGDEVAEIAVRG
jgi:type I restriction enzyme S subunit